jgi:hypothetical protein
MQWGMAITPIYALRRGPAGEARALTERSIAIFALVHFNLEYSLCRLAKQTVMVRTCSCCMDRSMGAV